MNVNKLIIDTLKSLVPNATDPTEPHIAPNVYKGTATTYITFNYKDDRAGTFADDEPQEDIAYMQIHLFTPGSFNYMTLKKEIRSRLFGAGFSYPSVQSLYESDTDKNHIIFQCEIEGPPESEEQQ